MAAGRLALARGDTAAVREALRSELATAQALHQGAVERWLLALVALSRTWEGDLATATRELARATELEDGGRGLFHNDIDRAKGWLAACADRLDAGAELLVASAADAAALGKRTLQATLLHDVVRLGRPHAVLDELAALAEVLDGPLVVLQRDHAAALAGGGGATLEAVGEGFAALGSPLLAAEAWAQAAGRHDAAGTGGAALAWARSAELARQLPVPLRTPALLRPAAR